MTRRALFFAVVVGYVVSGLHPYRMGTWFFETVWVGIGLLVANRIPEKRRRAVALALIGLGAATTIPAAKVVFGNS